MLRSLCSPRKGRPVIEPLSKSNRFHLPEFNDIGESELFEEKLNR
jgi:hypothetical protein